MSGVQADHERVRPETPTTFYDGAVRVPGFGSPPDRCRGLTPVGFCEDAHAVLGRSSCGTRYCPDHWRDWVEEAVINMVARLAAYRHAQDGLETPLSHVVASPPQDRRYSEREMWDTRTEAYEAMREAGVDGGAVVTHPYRTNERGNNLYETAVSEGDLDEDTGRWKFLRDAAADWEEMSRYVEAAPHYHTLAPTRYVDGEAAPEGWVVKRIRRLGPFHYRDLDTYREMVKPVYYTLTHGAVPTDEAVKQRSTVTYWGEIHPSVFNPEEELTAGAWSRIQKNAERAVKEAQSGEQEGMGHGPEECPREDCEAAVVDVVYLSEYLDNEDWIQQVRSMQGGRKRLLRLRGMFAWWDRRTDRPPPSVQGSEKRLLAWLEERGEAFAVTPQQVGLQTAVMS